MNCDNKKSPLDIGVSKGQENKATTQYNLFLLYNNIPSELKQYPNWVLRKNKVPYSVTRLGKKWQSLEDCGVYEDVIQALECGDYDGIGFQLSNSPYTVIDLDHCIDENGDITNDRVIDLLEEVASYWEYSPSGTGLHIWLKGETPKAVKNSPLGFEMYSKGRYITMTGNTPTGGDIVENQPLIDKLYNKYKTRVVSNNSTLIHWGDYPSFSDKNLQKKIEEITRLDKSGKFTELFYKGNYSLYGGDESSADMALCCILAYWCNANPVQMEQIFNKSALASRDKWQLRKDYRHRTINNAIGLYRQEKQEKLKKIKQEIDIFLWGK